MRRLIARKLLRRFGRRYDYDTGYMESILQVSPRAFFKFAKIFGAAEHREVTPAETYYAVKLVAALAEDCGPCAQLAVDMALEAGVEAGQIEAVLSGDLGRMSRQTAAGFHFAHQATLLSPSAEKARQTVRDLWGEAGVIELALCFAFGRVFPAIKAGMGHAKECRQVDVSGRTVEVLKQAG